MTLIAKRKTTETWREAVANRADGNADCLAAFDACVANGGTEAEAAYRSLAACGLLWEIQGPDDPGPRSAAADAEQRRDPHQVPNV